MNCSKCGKECANAAGKSAHERHCKADTQEPAAGPTPQAVTEEVILVMKGWKAIYDGAYRVEDNLGRTLGTFPDRASAVRFLEGSNKWIR